MIYLRGTSEEELRGWWADTPNLPRMPLATAEDGEWLMLGGDLPEALLKKLTSAVKAEAISLSARNSVSSVDILIIVKGRLVRELCHSGEADGWHRLRGRPQDWEVDAFDDPPLLGARDATLLECDVTHIRNALQLPSRSEALPDLPKSGASVRDYVQVAKALGFMIGALLLVWFLGWVLVTCVKS